MLARTPRSTSSCCVAPKRPICDFHRLQRENRHGRDLMGPTRHGGRVEEARGPPGVAAAEQVSERPVSNGRSTFKRPHVVVPKCRLLAGPCLSLTGDKLAAEAVIDYRLHSRRVDENTTDFSLTAAVREGHFTFLATCQPLGATRSEKAL